jgi:hypothetical protein
MVRVPNTFSLKLLGFGPVAHELPLHTMGDEEVTDFIKRCAAALRSHGRDFQAGHDMDNSLAAFESTLALLLEFREVYPERRAEIDIVLGKNEYPIPED